MDIAPALARLRDQVNERWPARNRAYDGILGDASHQARQSDHNLGNAIDVTNDPANGPNLLALRDAVLRDPRATYVIFNHEIESRVVSPFQVRSYTKAGGDPHEHHMHLSIDAAQRQDARDWDLAGVPTGGSPPPGSWRDGQALSGSSASQGAKTAPVTSTPPSQLPDPTSARIVALPRAPVFSKTMLLPALLVVGSGGVMLLAMMAYLLKAQQVSA